MLVETWMVLRVCMVKMGLEIVMKKVKPFLNLPYASTLLLQTKKTQKLVTYESGGVSSVVDYVLARKKDMKDVKVIPGEECVSQHKLVVMDMRIKRSIKKKAKGTRGRLKTWRLRSATENKEFKCVVEKIVVHGESAQERWNSLEHGLKNAAEKVCVQSKGGKKHEETWWWNEQVAEVIKRKKDA